MNNIKNKNLPLSEEELVNMGFEIVRFKKPGYSVGMDKFYELDYAMIRINKGCGYPDTLTIRFGRGKFILDNYYSVRFYTVKDIEELLCSLTKIPKHEL
jgi:hypothetical protein